MRNGNRDASWEREPRWESLGAGRAQPDGGVPQNPFLRAPSGRVDGIPSRGLRASMEAPLPVPPRPSHGESRLDQEAIRFPPPGPPVRRFLLMASQRREW